MSNLYDVNYSSTKRLGLGYTTRASLLVYVGTKRNASIVAPRLFWNELEVFL